VNPITSYKKLYLKSTIIFGAPAIENADSDIKNHYITINDKSFFRPVIRLLVPGKVLYCSYKK
jgi:hypothetical protein